MQATQKVKKRITPILIAPFANTVPLPQAEEEKGPIGPRKNPKLLKKGGEKAKQISKIIEGGKKLHHNTWIDHVKKFSSVNNVPYACALSDPNIKSGYKKHTFTNKEDIPKKRPVSIAREEPKQKRSKKGDETKEAEKHLKFLSKRGLVDEASLKKKRVATFEKIFEKYNRPFTDKNVI